ncbi:GAF domain-containing sensor histidine kinase [Frateuria soli]|uniref:sensor histidine kinase n=1 Tax=Frateuria soli TaxID=1542730 RepID=UPI001E3A4015|nr:GAF domain-containing sensor histidine kinase [Frateuria soli]UGB37689.1 PAS domain S-box protein [Frateuria soli]
MPTSLERLTVGQFLRREYQAILEDWEKAVRPLLSDGTLSGDALRNDVGGLLEQIIELTDRPAGGTQGSPPAATAHALQRLDQSVDLYEVVEEYSQLRLCILDLIDRKRVYIPPAEWRQVTGIIDHAIATAVKAYAAVQQRTLMGLDRISRAALENSALDALLQRLLDVFLESVDAADTMVVLLREGDHLVTRASAGLDGRLPPRYALGLEEGFAGLIARTRAPQMLRDAASSPIMKSPVAREAGVRAVYGVPLLSGEGEVVGVAHMGSLTAHDFSQQDKYFFRALCDRASAAIAQHLLRRELHESEQRFRATFDQAAVGIAHVALDGRWLRFNPRLCQMMGYGEAGLHGRTFQDITHPDDLAADLELMQQLLAERIPTYTMEKRYIRGDGSVLWANLTASLMRNLHGEPEYFIAVIEDIGGRKCAEAERERSRLAEQRARARLDAIIQAAPVGIGVLDADLRYLHVNEALAKLNGRSVDAHLGRRVEEVVPALGELLEGLLRGVLEQDRPLLGQELEFADPAHADRVRHFLANYAPVRTPAGERIGIAAVVVDVTDLKRAQLDAQAATRMRDELLAVVSHDLRSPLASLQMSFDMLGRHLPGARGEGQALRMLELMRRAAARMEFLIRDLLDLATLQSGRFSLQTGSVAVAALLEEACAVHQPLALEQGLALHVVNAADGTLVVCDAERIQQVLGNLLGNAIKFCPPGGAVTLGAELGDDAVLVSVADNGPGIAHEHQQLVFEPYWSAREVNAKGTGLGLHISKGIVEAHGGRIWVESEPGQGARFVFSLPRCRRGRDAAD